MKRTCLLSFLWRLDSFEGHFRVTLSISSCQVMLSGLVHWCSWCVGLRWWKGNVLCGNGIYWECGSLGAFHFALAETSLPSPIHVSSQT